MTDTPTAFCQNCGTPLTPAATRTVGPATYCEPCLDARLHHTPRPPAQPFPTAGPTVPNPGLAALLGLIPGVGAMYNEQYAKGIVHLVVFAVLVVLANDVNIFGLFIFGWECYMVIEAHHTARARRDHTPLPNPFGLNDIGERLGFGKAWPAGAPHVASVFQDATAAAAHAAAYATQQFHAYQQQSGDSSPFTPPTAQGQAQPQTPPSQVPPMPSNPNNSSDPFAPPPPSSFGDWPHSTHQYAQNSAAGTQQPWRDTFTSVPPAVLSPFATGPTQPMPAITGHHRFPAGAVLLIGAGVFFLLATTGIFSAFNKEVVVGLGLIALAVWLFLRRMLDTGTTFAPDGTPAYTLRSLRALRASAWVGLTGILFLLNTFSILRWNHSWPLYIILAGVMGFFERAAQHHATLYNPPSGPA